MDDLPQTATEKISQVPPVTSALESQRKMLHRLLESIDILEQRLSAISTPEIRDSANKLGSQETPEPMQVSLRIRSNTDMAEYAQSRIREIMSRLEI